MILFEFEAWDWVSRARARSLMNKSRWWQAFPGWFACTYRFISAFCLQRSVAPHLSPHFAFPIRILFVFCIRFVVRNYFFIGSLLLSLNMWISYFFFSFIFSSFRHPPKYEIVVIARKLRVRNYASKLLVEIARIFGAPLPRDVFQKRNYGSVTSIVARIAELRAAGFQLRRIVVSVGSW